MKFLEPNPDELTERERRLLNWSQSKTERPQKVTPEEMGEKLDAKFDSAVKKTGLDKNRSAGFFVRGFLIVAGLAVAGFLTYSANSLGDTYQVAHAENQERIVALTKQIADFDDTHKDFEQVDNKKVLTSVDDAQKVGQQVADLQNKYAGVQLRTEIVDGKSELVGEKDLLDLKNKMRKLLAPASYESGFDPSTQWISLSTDVGTPNERPAEEGTYAWKVDNVLDPGDGFFIPVNWQLRDPQSNELLGFASGRFIAAENTFTNIKVWVTSQGAARQPSDEVSNYQEQAS